MRTATIAKKYGVNKNTVKRWIKKGLLKATLVPPKWGGHKYYSVTKEDLNIYLKNCDRKATDD